MVTLSQPPAALKPSLYHVFRSLRTRAVAPSSGPWSKSGHRHSGAAPRISATVSAPAAPSNRDAALTPNVPADALAGEKAPPLSLARRLTSDASPAAHSAVCRA